jgi:hypothetical protein
MREPNERARPFAMGNTRSDKADLSSGTNTLLNIAASLSQD